MVSVFFRKKEVAPKRLGRPPPAKSCHNRGVQKNRKINNLPPRKTL